MKNEINFLKQQNLEIVHGKGMVDLPYHTHNSYVIVFITEGNLEICLKSEKYSMQEGMVVIVPSNVGISMKHISSYSYISFCFSGEYAKYFNERQPKKLVWSHIGNSMEAAYQSFINTRDADMLIKELTCLLGFKMKKNTDRQTAKNELVSQAVALMQEHTEDKYSVESIANQLYVSKYYFSHAFKEEMDISPKQYMIQNKLRRVKEKIMQEDNTTRIAEDMEFAAQSHMCSVFKRYMGVSISDYKKNLTIEI